MANLKFGKHKVVSFTYDLLDESGVTQEQNDVPMSYVHGIENRVFPEVMAAIQDAKAGEMLEIKLSPEQAFGKYDKDKTFRDKIENVPQEFLRVGAEASFYDESGEHLTMTVKSIDNGEIFLDGNHPFAGKTMTFKISVKDIRDASVTEIESGLATNFLPSTSILH